jgi:hypothetical protein
MSNISSLFATGITEVRRSWGWFLVSGILLMLLGIMCIGKAQTATTFSILALGWVLAISGVVWFVNSFQAWTWVGFLVYLLNAILRCVTGYLLIRHPDAGAEGVTMVLAALFIVGGLFRVAAASAIQFPKVGMDRSGRGLARYSEGRAYLFLPVSSGRVRGPVAPAKISDIRSSLLTSASTGVLAGWSRFITPE